MTHRIQFELTDFEGQSQQLTPVVDGRSLVELVTDFEREGSLSPVGGYGGLVLDYFNFGNVGHLFLGQQEPWQGQRVPVLACDCGEMGCWPLLVNIDAGPETVTWSAFVQPHRPGRDYSGFGPFVFDRDQYDAALAEAADPVVVLWRPTGPEELALVEASGWQEWPPRLPDQPIFYPVLNRDYATKIARDWNVPRSGVGFVTRFAVRRSFLSRYDVQQVGGESILEYWIPAEDLEAMNASIVGQIEVIEEFRPSA